MKQEFVIITKEEYERLIENAIQLEVLDRDGVDNWSDYRRTNWIDIDFNYSLQHTVDNQNFFTANWESEDYNSLFENY
jgi:hypothetical protein